MANIGVGGANVARAFAFAFGVIITSPWRNVPHPPRTASNREVAAR